MALTTTLTTHSAKILHGIGRGVDVAILYLAPAESSGVRNVCPWSSAGCRLTCLGETSGRMRMDLARKARRQRTRKLYSDSPGFWSSVRRDIDALVRRATANGDTPAVRLDGTSDLDLASHVASDYPNVRFYDYTKSYLRMIRFLNGAFPSNRHFTFSRSETNENDCLDILNRGGNVAVVFDTRRGDALPSHWHGYRVIDGDTHDHRFNDPRGVVVGLRAKGDARHDTTGFVVRTKRG